MKKFILFTLIFFGFFSPMYAIQVKGIVTDENEMPVSFATILIKDTPHGTTANNQGEFVLDLAPGKYTIIAKTIGYQSQEKLVEVSDNKTTINFSLMPQRYNLQEVRITPGKEDPAYPIMRKVIEKRKYHQSLVNTLETEIYLKGTLRTRSFPESIFGFGMNKDELKDSKSELGIDSNGRGVLYLLEELSHYYFKAPNKSYTEIKSVRQSGDPNGLGFSTMPSIVNIYENNIQLLGGLNERGFISPANSNAFFFYRFKYIGSFEEDGLTISKIQVTPKRKYEPLFQGFVYVVEDEWVFHSVDLLLTKTSQMNMLDTLRFEQSYLKVDQDVWIIQNQILYPTLNLFGFDIAGNFITSYSNQKVNKNIPDSVFNSKVISSYDPNAMNTTAEFWDSIRTVPLEKDEIRDFEYKDSMQVVNEQKADSLEKVTQKRWNIITSGIYIKKGKNQLQTSSILQGVNFNSVEGLNIALKMKYEHHFNKNKTWNTQLYHRYGFSNKQYNIYGSIGMLLKDSSRIGKSWSWKIAGGQYPAQINGENPISPLMNTAYTLVEGRNYLKIYDNTSILINLDRNWGNGLIIDFNASFQKRRALENTTNYSFRAKHDERITSNQPIELPLLLNENAFITQLSFSYQPGWRYIQYPQYLYPIKGKAPQFKGIYIRGIPQIFNSKSDFDKWSLEMKHQFNLKMLGQIDYRLESGGFLSKNHVNIPDYKHLNGNQTIFAGNYLHSFQLAPYYRFSNTAPFYLQGHAEWHLNGFLSNKIPLFKRLNWFFIAGANSLFINKKDYYSEISIGIENIGFKLFRFGRLDFVAGYESGVNKPRLGFRIGFSGIANMISFSTSRTEPY